MSMNTPLATAPELVAASPSAPDAQTVVSVRHWTDRLFSFRVTRPQSLRFRSGEFVMIGLPKPDGRPLLRAYSIASPAWDDELEFYSIKVEDGPLTSRLRRIEPGDHVIVRPKPTGTLVLDALLPGERLWLFSTGTGVAPFASILRDPDTYERYNEVILTHTCRDAAELEYGKQLLAALPADPLVGEDAAAKLRYLPTTTREPTEAIGRITDWIASGRLTDRFGLPPLSPERDRAMICGSMGLNTDVAALLEAAGLQSGANNKPGHYVLEKAFVS
ncbi:MAG: ferredoxin--NADP reductase [Pseudomonadota bacterium]